MSVPIPARDAAPPQTAVQAEALLLHCIDYRLADAVARYMRERGLEGRYDVVALAGAALAAQTPDHPEWAATFWGMLDVAIRLHGIHRVLLLDHRDCGAYRLVMGVDLAQDPDAETVAHQRWLQRLRSQIAARHPRLMVETLLMDLDGTVVALN